MTFFRYFPAKELVVVDDPSDPAIVHSVAVQTADLPVVERVRRGLPARWKLLEDVDGSRSASPDAGEQSAERGGHLRLR
jgi:hypothetical protein